MKHQTTIQKNKIYKLILIPAVSVIAIGVGATLVSCSNQPQKYIKKTITGVGWSNWQDEYHSLFYDFDKPIKQVDLVQSRTPKNYWQDINIPWFKDGFDSSMWFSKMSIHDDTFFGWNSNWDEVTEALNPPVIDSSTTKIINNLNWADVKVHFYDDSTQLYTLLLTLVFIGPTPNVGA